MIRQREVVSGKEPGEVTQDGLRSIFLGEMGAFWEDFEP